jgi:hypothetical protein
MAEISQPWDGTFLGDAIIAPYNSDEWTAMFRVLFNCGTDEGVFPFCLNTLEVTGVASPIQVDSGAALVYGTWYYNDTALFLTVPTPVGAARRDWVLLKKDWVTQTVRTVLYMGTPGAGLPVYPNTPGTEVYIPLAVLDVDLAGNIVVTDRRVFLESSELPHLASPSGLSFDATHHLQIDDSIAGAGLSILNKVLSVTSLSVTHDLLSATHTDVTPDFVRRGDIVYGKLDLPFFVSWARLPVGHAGDVLTTDGLDIMWSPGGAGGPHDLLSAVHTDTLVGSPLRGSVIVGNSTPKWSALAVGVNHKYLGSDGTDANWVDAVYSVAMTVPGNEMAIMGSPITTGGTLAVTWKKQTATYIFAGPVSGPINYPTFRHILSTDIVPADASGALVNDGLGNLSWGSAPALVHALLGTLHSDVTSNAPSRGDLIVGNSSSPPRWERLSLGVANKYLKSDGTDAAWHDAVYSVALALPGEFSILGSPVTTTGTLTGSWATQLANLVFAGPASGAAHVPTFRRHVSLDLATPDAAGVLTSDGLGNLSWAASPPPGAHHLLSASHDDTNPMSPITRGSVISASPGLKWTALSVGLNHKYLGSDGTDTNWFDAVYSVALSAPAQFSVSGSPVTTAGTLALSWVNQNAGLVFAGPAVAPAAVPTFRALVASDISGIQLWTRSGGTLYPTTVGEDVLIQSAGPTTRITLAAATGNITALGTIIATSAGTSVTVGTGIVLSSLALGLSATGLNQINFSTNATLRGFWLGGGGLISYSGYYVGDLSNRLYLSGSELTLRAPTSGVIRLFVDVQSLYYNGTAFYPVNNNVVALGGGGNAFSGLYVYYITSPAALNIYATGANAINMITNGLTRATVMSTGDFWLTENLLLSLNKGIKINSAAPLGHYLRGNGTIYTDGSIAATDLASPNAAGALTNDGAGNLSWSPSSVLAHALLGASHNDTLTGSVARGSLIVGNATPKWSALTLGVANKYLKSNGTDAAWSDAVYSVAFSAPAQFSVAGSPVTTTGTLALSWVNQNANLVLAGPVSAPAVAPTFRALVAADIAAIQLWTRSGNTLYPTTGGDDVLVRSAIGPTTKITLTAATGNIISAGTIQAMSGGTTTTLGSGSVTSGAALYLYASGVNNMVFSTNALARITILSNGNVGIGTALPNNILAVYGKSSFGDAVANTGGEPVEIQGASAGLSLYDRAGGAAERWVIYSSRMGGAGTNTLRFWSGSDLAVLTSAGWMGISTGTPRKTLDVLSTAGAQLRLTYSDSVKYTDFTVNANGSLLINTVNNEVLPEVDNTEYLGGLLNRWAMLYTGGVNYTSNLYPKRGSSTYTAYAYVPLSVKLTDVVNWTDHAYASTVYTKIILSATAPGFGAPVGIKAVSVRLVLMDMGVVGQAYFGVSPSGIAASEQVGVSGGAVVGEKHENCGICTCDANGDIYYKIQATSGASAHCWLEITGYFI